MSCVLDKAPLIQEAQHPPIS